MVRDVTLGGLMEEKSRGHRDLAGKREGCGRFWRDNLKMMYRVLLTIRERDRGMAGRDGDKDIQHEMQDWEGSREYVSAGC